MSGMSGTSTAGDHQQPCCHRSRPTHNEKPNGSLHFLITKHPREAFELMNSLRLSGKLCDISLRAESETFAAHRVVLASCSPYFKAMFCTDGMRECGMMEIPLMNVKSEILSVLINFAYTSEIDVNEKNVCVLLPAAVMFQMTHVIEACCTFLEHQLEPGNCIGIADFALCHGCTQLFARAREYLYQHFSDVCQCEEYLQLSLSQVIQVIKHDELNIKCETVVYDAVLRWVKYDEDKRCSRLDQLMSVVRCHFLTPHFLRQQLDSCALLRKAPKACIDYLSTIFEDLCLHRPCTERRRLSSRPCGVYILGGYLRHSLSNVECWNPESGLWYSLASLATPRSGVAACQLRGQMYLIGGRNNSETGGPPEDSPRVDCLNPEHNEWTRCSDMSVARNRVGVCTLDGMIYAVGGSHNGTYHKTVERYDCSKDSWSNICSMSTARIGVGVAVVNRLLYAVGGYDGVNRLSSVECYHPENDVWSFVSPMSVSRSGAGVCSMGQYIYAVGGYDGTNQLPSVERYSVINNQWETLTSMHWARSALGLAAVDNKLYAIGGYDGTNFLSSVERYDTNTSSWTEVANMTCGRSGHGVAVASEPSPEYAISQLLNT